MMKKILLIAMLLFPIHARSAGYLEFDVNGTPYKWDSATDIQFFLDGSNLGAISKASADTIVNTAFTTWSSLPGATLTFNDAGDTADITTANLSSFVDFNGVTCPTADFVVVYDDDGSIFTSLFGASAASGILGLASPSVLSNATKKITCAYALLNGALASDSDTLEYTVMHEFGHAQNLEHTEINGDLANNLIAGDDLYIPLMYPVIPQSPTIALTGGFNGLKLDDQFSLLYVYNQALLNSEPKIKGKVLDKKGDGVLGVNVICANKASPNENVVSWISDAELNGHGEYTCGHLVAGDYDVKIEPVTVAINSWDEGTPPFIPAEFYNGEDESFDSENDLLEDVTDITVPAATTVDSINVVINDNGKITSEKTVTGTVSASSVADLEYFIYVPKSVSKATFELSGDPSTADIDVYGKCDDPFSLALTTAGTFYNPASSTQQAEFAGASSDASESVILDSSSAPEIDNCEYHLVVVNYDAGDVDFELKVTLEGDKPELKADFQPANKLQENGETLVSNVIFEASNDQFTIDTIKFTDAGVENLSDVSAASFYSDENANEKIDDEDVLIATTTSVDKTNRTYTFSKLHIFIDEGNQKNFLISYTLPAAASSNYLMFLVLGVMLMTLVRKNKNVQLIVMLISLTFLGRCSSSSSSEFNPIIEKTEHITAEASGFGDKFNVEVGVPSSVKDFFN